MPVVHREELSEVLEDRMKFLPAAQDARDEPIRHGLEPVARRWAV